MLKWGDLVDDRSPEIRRDPISGRWVMLAPERADRPIHPPATVADSEPCPFCVGHEHETPPEVWVHRPGGAANRAGWTVRVVPNRYPAVRSDMPLQPPEELATHDPLAVTMPGWGRHEVVVEAPTHEWTISGLGDVHALTVFGAYRARLQVFRQQTRVRSAFIFHNTGAAAGASQHHVHSQIIVSSLVPPLLSEELTGAAEYFHVYRRSVFDDLLAAEEADGRRIIARTERFLAWCPFASRCPYELWIAPRFQQDRFDGIDDAALAELAALMRRLLERLEQMLPEPAYNYYLHSAPFGPDPAPHFRWHWEIAPRLVGLAGFEVGGGMFLNPVLPEAAARVWRGEGGDGNLLKGRCTRALSVGSH